jgi:hypothetical protein
MALTATEAEIVKQRIPKIMDTQNIIRKIMPIENIKKDAESIRTENITVDESILAKTGMETIEIPYNVSQTTKLVIDLNAKITRPTRTLDTATFAKLTTLIGKIIVKSENYYGFKELTDNCTTQAAQAEWSAADTKPTTIAEDIIDAIVKIQNYTTAPISLVLPTEKAGVVMHPNDYGLSPITLVKKDLGAINNIITTSLINEPLLVPNDSTIQYLGKATKVVVDKEEFKSRRETIVYGNEAICPIVDEKNAIIKITGA